MAFFTPGFTPGKNENRPTFGAAFLVFVAGDHDLHLSRVFREHFTLVFHSPTQFHTPHLHRKCCFPIQFLGGDFVNHPILVLVEQRQSDETSSVNAIVRQTIAAWLTKELRK